MEAYEKSIEKWILNDNESLSEFPYKITKDMIEQNRDKVIFNLFSIKSLLIIFLIA